MYIDASGVELDVRVATLKAVADPTRLRVVDLLASVGPRCHCELEEALAVPPNRLSFHLRILRDAGLVTTRRRGRRVDYQLDPAGLAALQCAVPTTISGGAR
jgi:ArsR family transcriptional regulator, arsenate/arsenite/antimonite-responsive transcriptional repressor